MPWVLAICGIVNTSLPAKLATAYAAESTMDAKTAPAATSSSTRAVAFSAFRPQARTAIASPATLAENKTAATIFTPGETTNPTATTMGNPATNPTTGFSHRYSPRLSANCSVRAAMVAVANPAK
jgi:hypothetical protein